MSDIPAKKIEILRGNGTETFEIGKEGVKEILINFEENLVKFAFEEGNDWDFFIIPLQSIKQLKYKSENYESDEDGFVVASTGSRIMDPHR